MRTRLPPPRWPRTREHAGRREGRRESERWRARDRPPARPQVCNELRAQQKGEQRRYDRAAKLRSERLGIELKPAARAPSPPPSGPTSRVMISPSVTA